MSEISPPAPSKPANPWKSPSYPQRVHIRERAHWLGILKQWDERVEQARSQLDIPGADAATRRRLAQMLGARDQLADAARRLPMEVNDLYAEDRHRLEEAVAALERLFADRT